MNYSELQLDSRLSTAIQNMGYEKMTPIQEQTIPHILKGQDVAGLAQTGTGKTAAFVIPLIERILKAEVEPENERAFKDWQAYQCILILVPTRELADQIHENIVKLTAGCGLKSYPFYGGTGYEKQKEALKSGLHFIVSTPGRLIDLYKEHHVDFKKVRAVVFDEADRMFDMGFKDDMKYILSRIERNRQFLVFSATLNFDVLNTAYQFGAEPVEINISRDQATADNVKDAIFHIGNNDKPLHLISLLKRENPKQVIIFTNFKNNVDRIAHFLTENQIPAMGISSLMNQTQRNNVIAKFKAENNQNVLVATDVAARGLDISGVDLVINYELPQDSESYVHRIGRTGRAGNQGKAFSFVSDKDVDSLARIEEYTKRKLDVGFIEDADLIQQIIPLAQEPSFKKRFDGPPKHQSQQRKGDRPAHDKDRKAAPHKGHHQSSNPTKSHSKSGPKEHKEELSHRKFTPNKEGIKKNHKKDFNRPPAGKAEQRVVASKANHQSAQVKKTYRTSSSQVTLTGKIKSIFRKIFG